MTRKEEIEKYCEDMGFPLGSCSSINSVKSITASDAIKWADKSMIERVLNFIFEHFWEHPHVSGHICTDSFESLEQMEEELIKAMEE